MCVPCRLLSSTQDLSPRDADNKKPVPHTKDSVEPHNSASPQPLLTLAVIRAPGLTGSPYGLHIPQMASGRSLCGHPSTRLPKPWLWHSELEGRMQTPS